MTTDPAPPKTNGAPRGLDEGRRPSRPTSSAGRPGRRTQDAIALTSGTPRRWGGLPRRGIPCRESDEPISLCIGDPQMTMHIDEVIEPQLAGEPVRAAERLCREPGQVVDVRRCPFGKQRAQRGIGQNLVVEEFLEAMECIVATGMLVQGFHCRLDFESLSERLGLSSLRPDVPHASRSRVRCGCVAPIGKTA
jgi:hypothetical protein